MSSALKKILFLVIIVGAGYFLYMRFMPHPGMGGMMPPQGGPVPVGVAEVLQRQVQKWSEFSGRLVAVDQVEIRPRVSGNIDSVHFKNGEMVKKGDLLFVIDPRPYEAASAAAKAQSTNAIAEFERAKILEKENAISKRDYEQRRNAAEVARADLTRSMLNLEYTRITAPISGKVSRAEITEGNLVEAGPNAPVLTTIVSNDPIYADFEVDEETYRRYISAGNLRGLPVRMKLDAHGKEYEGKIESFDNRLDPTSGTIRARALFENDSGELVPGLFARVEVASPSDAPAILITDRAVGTDQDKKFVLIVKPDNTTERREIKLGAMAEGLRIVESGLQPGEKIIVSGLQRVMMPGQPVTPEMVSMEGEGNGGNAQALSPAPADAKPAAGDEPQQEPPAKKAGKKGKK